MTKLSQEQLEAIRARCDAATEGPWKVEEDESYCEEFGCTPDGCLGHPTGKGTWVNGPQIVEFFEGACTDFLEDISDEEQVRKDKEAYNTACFDATFIAHSRTDVPALLAHIEAQDAEIAEKDARIAEQDALLNGIFANIPSSIELSGTMIRSHLGDETYEQSDWFQRMGTEMLKVCIRARNAAKALRDGGEDG